MSQQRITAELSRFIAEHIESVHTLEVLLILFRDPNQPQTVESIHAQVKSSLPAVQKSLGHLVHVGLARKLQEENRFNYSPKSETTHQHTRELATAYAERSVAVVEVIYSAPLRVAQMFSNAFEIRKKSEP